MSGGRFTENLSWNHQPALWIMTCLSMIYSTATLGVRAIRRRFTRADTVLIIGYAFALAHWLLMLLGLRHGTGKAATHLSLPDYQAAGQVRLSSQAEVQGVLTSILAYFLEHSLSHRRRGLRSLLASPPT